jgi:hypothetical protein
LHIDELWRLERGLVTERRESRFEETAVGIHVADIDLNVIEQSPSSLLDSSRTAPSESHVSWASVRECPLRLNRSQAWSERESCASERRVWHRDLCPLRSVGDARLSLHAGELLVNDA